MFAHVAANGGDKRRHAAEGPPAQTLARNLGEEALDEIQPRGPGRGEVEMKARVLYTHGLDLLRRESRTFFKMPTNDAGSILDPILPLLAALGSSSVSPRLVGADGGRSLAQLIVASK